LRRVVIKIPAGFQ